MGTIKGIKEEGRIRMLTNIICETIEFFLDKKNLCITIFRDRR